ncbi:hypothetical protein ACHAXR_009065 [Thalassiosira sp. AJA248-18]
MTTPRRRPIGSLQHPTSSSQHPKSPIAQYFNRKRSSKITTNDLPMEANAIGLVSPMGIFFSCVKLTVPLAYVYILLILWRELCFSFPQTMLTSQFMLNYFHVGVWMARTMRSSSLAVEVWAVIEGVFYVILFLHRKWLNSLDTLELSLRSAPMLETGERAELWELMMESEEECSECSEFISGWFFGEKIENLTRYDVMDFLTWSLFEGRNIEHLTQEEMYQLREFVADLEYRISIELHGTKDDDDADGEEKNNNSDDENGERIEEGNNILHPPSPTRQHLMQNYGIQSRGVPEFATRLRRKQKRLQPKETFQFQGSRDQSHHSYFSNLYESYKVWWEQRNLHPVQDIRNYVAEKREHTVVPFLDFLEQLHHAEQSAVATASESLSNMYENAYFTLIQKDGTIDKQITALSHATQSQIADAWNSMWMMKERLRTASDISSRRKTLTQQLKSYRQTLAQMRGMATAVPSKQMADLMKKITQCYEALEVVEHSAMDAFMQVTGYVGKNLLHNKEPPRYLKYSCDPLMDVASYPLMFHILILVATEGGLRVMMRLRGFQRLRVGPVSYYYHPGKNRMETSETNESENEEVDCVPIVFCHGIGVGLIFYMTLVDELMALGRPLILPEIPYVSGFRPWQGPNCVLPPAAVTSSLLSILACHGASRGAFCGHSYGTSWVSFMCKYAPSAVAAVLFLDPVCFCLHCPRLTKKFVYHRADPGSTSHMIRTDVNVNWTIQRGFPWARISLFTEQIPCVPCAVFLSEHDALVPSAKVEKYLRSKALSRASHPITVTIFSKQGHGDWPLELSANRQVAQSVAVLVNQIRSVASEEFHS